jgi:hypothetical protein
MRTSYTVLSESRCAPIKGFGSDVHECLYMICRFNPLPLLFKSLLPGQEDCGFFSVHLNLHAKPLTGIPYREKIITIKLKQTE